MKLHSPGGGVRRKIVGITVLGKYISIISRREQKYLNAVMQSYGLGFSSYNFLLFLAKNEGCTQKELCRKMGIDEAVATRSMKKMEKEGYVRRIRSEQDSRKYALFLDDKGRALIPVIREALEDWWGKVLQDFPQEQQDYLLPLMEHMSESAMSVSDEMTEERGENDGSNKE